MQGHCVLVFSKWSDIFKIWSDMNCVLANIESISQYTAHYSINYIALMLGSNMMYNNSRDM